MTDLTLSKIGTPDSILAGNILTYVLTVSNTGSSAATGVTVLDTLPIEVSYVSRTAQQGFCSGTTTISCSLGTLGVGAITTIVIDVAVDALATGTITNTATVTGNETDPDSSNNTATSTSAVNIEVDVSLSPGYNLICIPVAFAEPFRARDLGKSLLPEGTQIEDGPVTAVLQWDGAYTFWLSSNPADNNYALEPGQGYFVRLQSDVPGNVFTFVGSPVTGPVTLDFAAGYNLVGVPFTSEGDYDARSFAEALRLKVGAPDIERGPVLSILRWAGVYSFWLRDNPDSRIFDIERSLGYFVRLTQAVLSFTP